MFLKHRAHLGARARRELGGELHVDLAPLPQQRVVHLQHLAAGEHAVAVGVEHVEQLLHREVLVQLRLVEHLLEL